MTFPSDARRPISGDDLVEAESALQFLPLDFLREISLQSYRQLMLAEYSAARGTPEDLSFCCTHADKTGRDLVFADVLPWDTGFFGYRVAKLHAVVSLGHADMPSAALRQLVEAATLADIRYLFCVVDARDLRLIRGLAEQSFSLIETRVMYARSLLDYVPVERYPCRLATALDIPSLSETAAATINPFDRFHADPFIDPERADALMRQWVEASVLEEFADATLVPDAANPTAFMTTRLHRKLWPGWGLKLSQIVLSAVSRDFRGWHRKLLSEAGMHMRKHGAEHIFMPTQLTNIGAIRSCERLGWALGSAQHVFRRIL